MDIKQFSLKRIANAWVWVTEGNAEGPWSLFLLQASVKSAFILRKRCFAYE